MEYCDERVCVPVSVQHMPAFGDLPLHHPQRPHFSPWLETYVLFHKSFKDRGQTDCVTTRTRIGLRCCCWPRPRHAARLATLARS